MPKTTKASRTVLVCYTIELPVTFEGWDDHQIQFGIEENSCLGTHQASIAFDNHLEKYETGDKQGYCWACALNCEAKIIKWD